MSEEPDPIARSICDGDPVDWTERPGSTGPSSGRPLDGLRAIARIADFHRNLQRAPESAGVLEESTPAPEGLPVQWDSFVLLECVGRGASGTLYRAWDADLQREVALKLLRPEASGRPGGVDPLLREGRNLARVRHPNVVGVHGVRVHEGRVGLWMEFLRGASLEMELRRGGPWSALDAARTAVILCGALEAVHAAGLLHRDVKPSNIVREPDGRIVLTDFGLGEELVPLDAEGPTSGTPLYMPREVLSGAAPSVDSDLYATGVALYYLLTGRHPYEASTLEELRRAQEEGRRASLAERRPDLPAELVRVVERAIDPEPSRRFTSAGAFGAALEGFLRRASDDAGAKRVGRWPVSRGALLSVFILAIVVAGAVFAIRGWRSPSASPEAAGSGYRVEANFLRLDAAGESPIEPGDRVAPGDMLALELRASRPVYLYVVNEDDRGEAYRLYPHPDYDDHNPLSSDRTHRLPGRVGGEARAWGVSSTGGREHFYLVTSTQPLEDVERELANLPSPVMNEASTSRAVEPLRGTGHLVPAPARMGASAPAGTLVLDRFRRLFEEGNRVPGVWVRHVVLENTSPAASPP